MKETGSRLAAEPLSGLDSCVTNSSGSAMSGSPNAIPGSTAAWLQTEDIDEEAATSIGHSAALASSSPNELASTGTRGEFFSLHGFGSSPATPDSAAFNHVSADRSAAASPPADSAPTDRQASATFAGRSHAASPAAGTSG